MESGDRPEAGAQVEPDPEMERLISGSPRTVRVDLGEREWARLQIPVSIGSSRPASYRVERGRLVVTRPLLTDEVGATVLSLSL